MKNKKLLCRSALVLPLGLLLSAVGCGGYQSSDGTAVAALNLQLKGDFSGGTVVSQPAGIDCGTTCASTFAVGQSITLTVNLSDSTDFVGWDGDCTGSSPTCTLSLDKGKNVGATFKSKTTRANVALTIGGAGGGLVTSMPFGIQCSGGTCSGGFDKGTMLTLTAAPDTTSYFTGWTGGCTGSARTCTITLTSDVQISANFGNPASCEQLRADNPTLTDGARKLFVGGDKTKSWDAYCVMSVTPALSYLPLTNVAATQNFSQIPTGGGVTGTTVKTNYTRLLIDPSTLKIDTGDRRFAASTGAAAKGTTNITAMPYATAMACNGTTTAGTANIDLTGTKFAVATGALVLGGTTATGMATPTPDGQVRVINLTGNGSAAACGWFAPTGASTPINSAGSPLQLVYFP